MRKSNQLDEFPPMDDIRIIPQGNNKYEVFFDFLSVPVNMNKGYLEAVIKDLNSDCLDQRKAI